MSRARQEFSKAVRLAAWDRAGGRCEGCTRKLFVGDIHYDHRNPDGLTGQPTAANCQVLCRSCHAVKTKADVANIARAKRREVKHIGIRSTSRPMPGGKQSRFKIKIGGGVVDRFTGEPV
jgi:5-methylcytosine-specific restriction protein A